MKKNDLKIMSALKNGKICVDFNSVGEEKSEYINVGVKKMVEENGV